MNPDLYKPETSAIFESFGFGAINLLAIAYFYREIYDVVGFVETVQTVESGSLPVLIVTSFVFVAYITGLGAIQIGELLGEKRDKEEFSSEAIQAICIKKNNQYVWESYKAMNRKVNFALGVAGTSSIIALLLVFELVAGFILQLNWGFIIGVVIAFSIAVLMILGAKLRARTIRRSFDAVLVAIT